MDSIKELYEKHGFDLNSIEKVEVGGTYVAVMLKSGFIGLSANLTGVKLIDLNKFKKLDFNNFIHRNLLNAYYNAKLNNIKQDFINVDIFDFVHFLDYSKIVMVGFSEPMYKKLERNNIKLTVFDDSISSKENSIITSIEKQESYLHKADAVILTSTSIMNNTFGGIIKCVKNDCDIFMFGASTLMDEFMFRYSNVKGLFGTVFTPGDKKILDIINKGHGHRYLKKHGKKVALIRE